MQRRVGLRWALAAAVLLQLAATSVSASALKSIDPCVLEDYERNIEYDLEPFFTTSGCVTVISVLMMLMPMLSLQPHERKVCLGD